MSLINWNYVYCGFRSCWVRISNLRDRWLTGGVKCVVFAYIIYIVICVIMINMTN